MVYPFFRDSPKQIQRLKQIFSVNSVWANEPTDDWDNQSGCNENFIS